MRRRWEGLLEWVVQDPALPLEQQFFQSLCLLGGLLSIFVVVPMNHFQDMNPWVNRVIFVFGLLSLALSWAARRGKYFKKTLLLAITASLDLVWFANGGSQGSIGLFFFTVVLFLVLFFEGAFRYLFLGLLMANIIGLHVAEQLWPSMVKPFSGPTMRVVDLGTGYVLSMSVCALMLWVVLLGFNREKRRLAESERLYRELLERQGEGFSMVDAQERFVVVNPVAEQIFGVAPGQLLGRSLMEFLPEDQQDIVRGESRLRVNGIHSTYELQIRRADGDLRTLQVTATPRPDQEGKAPQVIGVYRDITERKESEKKVQESEEKFRTYVEQSIDVIFTLDAHGTFIFVSPAWERHFGIPASDVIGKPFALFVDPEDTFPLGEYLNRVLSTGQSETSPAYRVRHADGSWRWFRANGIRMSTPGGEPRFMGVAHDITERKMAEEAERLLEQEKYQAQKMDSLGSLAGGVAHDFNNMLSGIMGYADLLLAGEHDPHRQKHLRAIISASSRSAELTQKLLAFGRRGKNRVESLDLQTMVKECLDMLRPSMSPDLQVLVDMDGCPTVDGDPSQIHQVLVNLCINAIEAMPERGTLTLAAGVRDVSESSHPGLPISRGAVVEFTVSDTGIGMTEAVRQRIFEPFFTTKNTSEMPGTGLGLSTAYGIIHTHRGAITVESARGKGSTFRVLLPVGTLAPVPREAGTSASQGHGLVLLVEDEPLLSEMVQSVLESLGYEVVTAADGMEAVKAYRAGHQRLHAVLLDLKMPRMAGREAFLEMRKINPGVPVIVCTGYGENEEVQELLTLGAAGMLSKPYRISELAAKLEQVTAG